MTACPKCTHQHIVKAGKVGDKQRWRCRGCGYQFTRYPARKTRVAEIPGGVPLLSWCLHERLGEDVQGTGEFGVKVAPPVCDRTRRQTRAHRESHCPGTRRDVALPQKKRRKLWIWKALDRATGQLLDWECGRCDAVTLKKLVDRLAHWDVMCYCTDHWPVYAGVIPPERLVMSKARTDGIERHHCRQRHGFGRLNGRRSRSPRPRTWWS